MAYEAGVPSSIEDLVTKLFTFATANGWTQDELDLTNNYGTLHYTSGATSIYVSFRWDTSPSTDLAIYQSLGWTTSLQPHQQPNDSGNGDTTTPINAERRVTFLTPGPYTQYYFFSAETDPFYFYAVVEITSGVFRHFGFGALIKMGNWTGGEFAYGHVWSQNAAQIDDPSGASHAFLLDCIGGSSDIAGTVHIEGMPGQGGTERWGCTGSFTGGTAGTDTAGVTRRSLMGGSRGGFWGYYMLWFPYSTLNAYKPLVEIPVIWRDTSTAPDTWQWLGVMPDVALINIRNLNAGDEITLGAETWKVFPWVRKQFLQNDTEETRNAGVAYRKQV
jgi:hypothetical protein